MKRLIFTLGVALSFALGASGATNVVASGTSAIVVPATAPQGAFANAPTGTVAVAGAYYREGRLVFQFTANGWEVCPTTRRLVVVQRLSGAGTAVVMDGQGDLVRLTPAYSAVVLTDASAPLSHVSVRAEGGDVTISASHR